MPALSKPVLTRAGGWVLGTGRGSRSWRGGVSETPSRVDDLGSAG